MGLEEILMLIGAKNPFKKNGKLTESGEKAYLKLVKIVNGLDCIGALGKTGDELENYLDEVIRLGF